MYKEIKYEILRLSKLWDIQPTPIIDPAKDTDPCDVTDPPFIRIKPVNVDYAHHARHVLGHYIADLHLTQSDYVADLIAELLKDK